MTFRQIINNTIKVRIGRIVSFISTRSRYGIHFLILRNAGIIRSALGAKGGYELARSPGSIDVVEVVEVLEGRASLLKCTDRPVLCARSPIARPSQSGSAYSI